MEVNGDQSIENLQTAAITPSTSPGASEVAPNHGGGGLEVLGQAVESTTPTPSKAAPAETAPVLALTTGNGSSAEPAPAFHHQLPAAEEEATAAPAVPTPCQDADISITSPPPAIMPPATTTAAQPLATIAAEEQPSEGIATADKSLSGPPSPGRVGVAPAPVAPPPIEKAVAMAAAAAAAVAAAAGAAAGKNAGEITTATPAGCPAPNPAPVNGTQATTAPVAEMVTVAAVGVSTSPPTATTLPSAALTAGGGGPSVPVPQPAVATVVAAPGCAAVPTPQAAIVAATQPPVGDPGGVATGSATSSTSKAGSIAATGAAPGVFADISAFAEESSGISFRNNLPQPPPPPATTPTSSLPAAPSAAATLHAAGLLPVSALPPLPAAADQGRGGGLAAAAGLLLVHHSGATTAASSAAGAQQAVGAVDVMAEAEELGPRPPQHQQDPGLELEQQVRPTAVREQGAEEERHLHEESQASDLTTAEAVAAEAQESREQPGGNKRKARGKRPQQQQAKEEEEEDDEDVEAEQGGERSTSQAGGGRKKQKTSSPPSSIDLLPPPPAQSAKRKKQSPKKQLQQRQAAAATAAAAQPGKPKQQQKKLQLHAPSFEIEKHGGGKIRKRYSLDFKVNAARYALSKDPKGQAKGGTVGARYAAAQLGVPESQSVREWMKRLPEMEEALERAQAIGGESASRHARRKKSMSNGRVPSTHQIEDQLLAFIEEESASYSNGLSMVAGLKKVSSRAVKDKAQELMPDVFGVAPSPDDNYGGGGDDYQAALKRHEAKISSWCHRFLRRHRVASLCENPLKKNKRAAGGGGGGGGGGGWAGYGGKSSGCGGGGDYEEGDEGRGTEDDAAGGGGGDDGDGAEGPRPT